jgi:hypothetical protein
MGEKAYIRIQNKSTYDVTVKHENVHRVDDEGMDKIQGAIAPGGQLPKLGEDKFGGQYQCIEGESKFFFQKDGYFALIVEVEGSSPSSLELKVDNNDWWTEDKTADQDSLVKVVADVDDQDHIFKIEVRIYNNYHGNSWMADLAKEIQDTPLCRVALPGTHDSGTYVFNKDLGASPDHALTTSIQEKLDFLGGISDAILDTIYTRLSKTQSKSIREQLEMGVRYLDIRVAYHRDSGQYYTCHGVYCVDMKDVTAQVNDFLSANPKEIVILDINHLHDMNDQHNGLIEDLLQTLGDKVAVRKQVHPHSKVKEYWNKGFQAVIFYQEQSVTEGYDDKIWPRGYIWSPWPNTSDPVELHAKLSEYVDKRGENLFFVLQGLLSPDVALVKDEILDSGGVTLEKVARRCSGKVVDWVDEHFKDKTLNIVIADFVENCSMIPAVININRK